MRRLKGLKGIIINMLKTLGVLLLLWGIWGVIQLNKPLTIKDIAYDNLLSVVNKFEGYTVYLKENGEYEPYLVLSKNYNGAGDVLLLRKYLLDEPRIFNTDDDKYGAYYENSKIDQFLNSSFLGTLEKNAQTKIVTSDLEITAKSSIGSVGKEIITIPRKAFLLSHREIAGGKSVLAPKEGKKLLYFIGFHSYVATTKVGEAEPYWLRTPYTEYGVTVWGVKSSGELGNSTLWNMNDRNLFKLSVRPAFCMAKDTKLERKAGIEKGKQVFVLKETSK